MNGWFTIEKIDTQTFAISEYQHYEETHCYLLCGQNKAALIDTGLGVSNIKSVVNHLTTLPVTVFTTHVHWDHIGGHKHFGRIAVHEAEKNWIDGSFPLPLEAVKAQLTKLPCAFPEDFDVDAYRLFQGTPQILLHDGVLIWADERSGCCTRRDTLPDTAVFTSWRKGTCIPAIWFTKVVWTPFIQAQTRCFFISQ